MGLCSLFLYGGCTVIMCLVMVVCFEFISDWLGGLLVVVVVGCVSCAIVGSWKLVQWTGT